MKLARTNACFIAVVLLLWASLASALHIPDKPTGYVNDYAKMLKANQVATLNSRLKAFEAKTSNQVVVAIFPSLDGARLERASILLAERWKIGTKKHDNGVILLVFKKDRKIRIEVGYGLEGAIPDALAGKIIQKEIAPEFKQQNYYQGISNGVNAIMLASKGEYRASIIDRVTDHFGLFLLGLFLIFLYCYARYPAFRQWIWDIWDNAEVTYGGRGSINIGSGGGGFSGGGGSFGGGGASGGW